MQSQCSHCLTIQFFRADVREVTKVTVTYVTVIRIIVL